MTTKNCMLKKQTSSLIIEVNESKKYDDKLKVKNDNLDAKILDLTICLKKFIKGQKSLNLLLGSQKCVYDRVGIGYNSSKKQKLYKNIFVKASYSKTQKFHVHFVIPRVT